MKAGAWLVQLLLFDQFNRFFCALLFNLTRRFCLTEPRAIFSGLFGFVRFGFGLAGFV